MRAVRDVDKVVVQQSRAELDGCWGKEVNIGTGGGTGASRDGVKGVGGGLRVRNSGTCVCPGDAPKAARFLCSRLGIRGRARGRLVEIRPPRIRRQEIGHAVVTATCGTSAERRTVSF